ncbi:MAG: FtsX-like permease family protein [Cyclobacteriaceae bacterium]|nr:FtsX-like permease family protein [Cyclobacteriaceae bacterium]
MIRNYLTIAFRNLRKQGFYSFINIAGLAVGVAACLIIVLFIKDELGYDAYNTKADRIYRVKNEITFGGENHKMLFSSAPVANALQQDYPEIEATVRFRSYGSYLVRAADGVENIKEHNVMWTDSTFFKVFSVKVLQGDPKTALTQPASIAISKRIADKYFPGKDALGQSMIMDNKYNAKITAVYENIPQASHFHFDILFAMVGNWPVAREAQSPVFLSNNFTTYLLLKEGASGKELESKLPVFLKKYIEPQLAKVLGGDFTMEKFKAAGNKYEISLSPLLDIHLHSDLEGEFEPNGSITYVYLFGTIALFILTIACINFMNLSTARSGNRAKEVGVRKVMGSLRSYLVWQFLTESTLITLFSFVFAIGVAFFFLPVFNALSLKELHIPFSSPAFYLILFGAALLIGVAAGVYPSFFLSAFKPAQVLKGQVALGSKSGFIRSGLVVFQFVISIFLIVGAITVNRQLSFVQTKKLGFDKSQVLIVHDAYALRPNKVQTFKSEALKINSIESVSISGFLPVTNENSSRNNNSFWKEGNPPSSDNLVGIQNWDVDHDYVKTFKMKIKSGRDFSEQFPSDSSAVILNEEAVQKLGLGEDPVGKKISSFAVLSNGSPNPDNIISWTVIGVIESFHFSSMKESISGMGLFLDKSDGFVSLRFNGSNSREVIQSIEKIWKQLAPGQPFQYSFLDEDFGKMYDSEQRLGNIFSIFAVLAIMIASLGLFALTSFTAEQRTKEIGIRKVLGASVSSIIILLSKEFGKLIVIAFVLAVPLAWFGVDWWLKNYTYKAEIGIFVYLLAGVFTFLIAWFTMSFQSFKAASNDPIKSLRSE